jgi:hypothetical protein
MATSPPNRLGAKPPRVLVVIGGDHIYKSSASGRGKIMGISDVDGLLPETVPTRRINLSLDLEPMLMMLKQQGSGGDLSAFDCVLNLVSEPDRSPKTLEAIGLLLRGFRGLVINRPEAVLGTTREQVANALCGIPGLVVPRILRFRGGDPDAAVEAVTGAGLNFPLIVRHPATHRGRTMVLVEDEVQFRDAVNDEREYFAIEFVDYRVADGLFHKYRIWSFGGRQVFRHLAVTSHWNVHIAEGNAFMADRADLIAEEVRLMERPEGAFADEVHAIVAAIGERLRLDCFGIDFGFHADGRMVLFEANASMTFFPLVTHPTHEYRAKLLAPAQAAFAAMLGLQDRALGANARAHDR